MQRDISILYVEDEAGIRKGYARALEHLCDRLYLAENGKEGLSLYQNHRPDIVISDIRMPLMDGLEMLHRIRAIDPECHFIFTTAYSDIDYMQQAIDLHVDSYLQKPVQKRLLQEKVTTLSERIEQMRWRRREQEALAHQKAILQNVLDHEQNMLVVTDFRKALFANKAFLENFHLDSVEEFNQNALCLTDIFLPLNGYLHSGLIKEGETLYDLLERSDETDRMVTMIDQHGLPKAYQISISRITHLDKASYLLSLTDITKLNIEKISTEKKAYYDTLTQVYNRNKFDELFAAELSRVNRYGVASSLVLIDIDHFKHFNDTYGHLTGDKVLQKLAGKVSENIRNTDIFARWGGEEFVLLLPETALHAAMTFADKMRAKVAEIEIEGTPPITASFGVTQLRKSDTAKEAFRRADEALYDAKGAGRNRVSTLE